MSVQKVIYYDMKLIFMAYIGRYDDEFSMNTYTICLSSSPSAASSLNRTYVVFFMNMPIPCTMVVALALAVFWIYIAEHNRSLCC